MPAPIEDRIAVSTWSLHRLLGTTYPHAIGGAPVGPVEETYGPVGESLLDLPSALEHHGYHRLELVSFHLPSRDATYIGELRAQLDGAGVTLQTLLIDAGDITDPVNGARDTAWIAGWIETANQLGAKNARIIAGKQPPTREALDRSVTALKLLADGNAGSPVRVVTENWHDLLSAPEHVNYVLDRLEGRVGLLADFGNWTGPTKYDALAQILARAELTHAKASFIDGDLDQADYAKCLDLAQAAGYAGPFTLIYDSEVPSEWAGLGIERDFITTHLA
jgi:sugar phosphate isomerase/epimerase